MNATLRDVLARHAVATGDPAFDVDRLVGLGESRLRRRRLAALLVSAGAIVIVVALALGVALNRPAQRGEGPAGTPTSEPARPLEQPLRKIVYSDAELFSHAAGNIHFGDRVIRTANGFVHMDVTDGGFVYTTRGGRVWFSDGGRPQQVGTACGASPNGEISTMSSGMVVTANAGPLAAWFDCSSGPRGDLVVFDTGSNRELLHRRLDPCQDACTFAGLAGDRVYLDRGIYAGFPRPELSVDVPSGRVSRTSQDAYAEEIGSMPRGLVVGDSRRNGTVTAGIGVQLRAVGSRLEVWWRLPNGEQVLTESAFDTATGKAVQFRLPMEYHAAADEDFTLFEWLDDETVALVAGGSGQGNGAILTCRLADGRCDVAVKAPADDGAAEPLRRIVAQLPLPG
jgi:hypothetical protein